MTPAASVPDPAFPPMWRRLGGDGPAVDDGRADEFPAGASGWPAALSRRDFVRTMGASLALAGLAGCDRTPAARIVPRVASPESGLAAGDARYFTTAVASEGYARGIIVTAQSGRPVKIEGNPDHPESLGATDVFMQAALLSLYDPDRSAAPRRDGRIASWREFETEWLERRRELDARGGEGVVVLTEPTTSPTVRREIHRLLDIWPGARWFQHTPLGRHDHRGVEADYDFAAADVIFALESDCCYRHPAAVRYGRALAGRRRVEAGRVTPPRFHALDAVPSITSALADFRLPASPGRARLVLDALAGRPGGRELSPAENSFVRALAADLEAHRGRVACVAGPECPPDLRDWARALNQRFGAEVTRHHAAQRSDDDPRCAGDLAAFAAALADGARGVFVLGCNPVYTSPPELDLAGRLARAPFVVHLGETCDETGAAAHWHLSEAHFLETWSDLRAYGGGATIQQPLIEPLHASRSAVELLRLLAGNPGATAYDAVRATWLAAAGAENFEARWHDWLSRGVVDLPATRPESRSPAAMDFPPLAAAADASLTLLIRPDPSVLDGRHANNPWLQELPRPLSSVVWDNPVQVGPGTAAELGLGDGDLVACEIEGRTLTAPVCVMPGQAAGTVVVTLGYGRTRAGSVGNGVGANAYALRTSAGPWQRGELRLRKLGGRRPLVTTQGHFAMEGRDLARLVAPADAGRARPAPAPASLLPERPRDGHAWGMSIDLGTCLGCSACVLACQAENNIPVVGREQVARGREMHWIRIDRYFSGPPENPRFVAQPVPCMQCENAPCELVCPVAATVHSSEGLNDMVYNRCIGTRYCSNNCPYKVRRFNFLDYRAPRSSPAYLQANPQVTIRERGVMEKCTYCVQRINAGRIAAEREARPLRDGEIRTACQQACPAEAIVFGDLNDPASRVSRRKAEPGNYALLEELNTRPRTTYLPAVRHPLPS